MQKQKLVSILRKILACPTAPFREERVIATLRKLLEGHPGISLRQERGADETLWRRKDLGPAGIPFGRGYPAFQGV
jgi:hypothetical protein